MFKKGFTLIELLVVIAIIAILAAILFPVFAQAREKARQSACLSNLKQIGTAIMLYVDDNHETYPLTYTGNPWVTTSHFPCLLNPYIKNYAMWYCPSHWNTFDRTQDEEQQRLAALNGGYGANGRLMGYMDATNFPACAKAVKAARVKSPSNVVAINDYSTYWYQPDLITGWRGFAGQYLPGSGTVIAGDGSLAGEQLSDYNNGRHNEGVNICYADGHAGYEKSNIVYGWVSLTTKNPFIPESW